MYKDYHYINRCVIELDKILSGSIIFDVFSQEKDTLYLSVPNNEFPFQHLLISTNAQAPFILLKSEHHKAKKNIIGIFNELLPLKIIRIEIAEYDRIINILCDKAQIVYSLKGGLTNLYLICENKITASFKKLKEPESTLINTINHTSFNNKKNYLHDYTRIDISDYSNLKKAYPYISKKLFNEIKVRHPHNSNLTDLTCRTIDDIYSEKISLYYDNITRGLHFIPKTFHIDDSELLGTFSDYNSAMHRFISYSSEYSSKKRLSQRIEKYLEKEINIYTGKLNSLKSRIDKGSKENEYYSTANTLLTNLYKIKKGMTDIELTDPTTNIPTKIKLDPKLSANENVDYYFSKAKDEKNNYSKSKELFAQSKKVYENLIRLQKQYEQITCIKQLREMIEQLKLGTVKPTAASGEQIRAREYIVENKYHIFVGKDSKSNDTLSMKFAKQNDYWFHARGYSGSHVILRVDNPKEGIPKRVLQLAASIAAFYSKAKTANLAPVAYTLRKYVRKRKGMDPGQVLITNEKVLLVKPEIPTSAQEAS